MDDGIPTLLSKHFKITIYYFKKAKCNYCILFENIAKQL